MHEFGHYMVAKLSGMYVEEFSLGMGPRLFKFQIKETVYSLRILPIGGFVKILGEEFDDEIESVISGENPQVATSNKAEEKKSGDKAHVGTDNEKNDNGKNDVNKQESNDRPNPKEDPRSFLNKSIFLRFAVMVAGVTMNIVLAVACFYVMLAIDGFVWRGDMVIEEIEPVLGDISKTLLEDSNVYYSVAPGGNAEKSGIPQVGVVNSIDGEGIEYSSEFIDIVSKKTGQKVRLDICEVLTGEDGTFSQDSIDIGNCGLYSVEVNQSGKVGVYIYPNYSVNVVYGGIDRVFSGFGHLVDQVRILSYYLPRFVKNSIAQKDYKTLAIGSVSSPIGLYFLVDTVKDVEGGKYLLHLLGMMSMMLAIVNLIPIPALDGGRALLLLIEGLRGKPLNKRLEFWIIQISFYGLLAFMFVVFVKDVVFIKDLSSMFN